MHSLVYLALLGGLLALTDLHASWTLDDGAYATQVKTLEQTGRWAYPYRWVERDPDHQFAPASHSYVTTQASHPYVKRPAWVFVLQASTKAFGTPLGLYVPSLLGAWAAALVAWALAERLRPGTGSLGFWAVGLGPVVVHSSAMWAHTWSAALGGVLAVLIVDVHRGRSARWHLPALVAVPVLLISFRTEGALVAAAAAVALAVAAAGPRRDDRRAAFTGAARTVGPLLLAAAGAFLATRWWTTHLAPGPVVPGSDAILTDLGFLASRWSGFTHTFVNGRADSARGNLLGTLTVGCWLVVGVLLARRAPHRLVVAAATLGLALTSIRLSGFGLFDLAGALVALPLLTVAIAVAVAGPWRRPRSLTVRWSVGAYIAGHTALILATQYPEGGSVDWGGRFLFPVLVPATVLAVFAVSSLGTDWARWPSRRVGVTVVAVLVALPTALGWLAARDVRSVREQYNARLEAPPGTTVICIERFLTRGAWRLLPEHDILSADHVTARQALAMLRPGRTQPVLVVGRAADRVRAPGYRRTVRSADVVVFTPS